MLKIAISGWYGRGNIGDEFLMCAVTNALRREMPDARLHVLSHDPESARAATNSPAMLPFEPSFGLLTPAGLRSVAVYGLRTGLQWPRLIRGLDALVLGGGSLLKDRHPATLPMWLRLVRLYRSLGVRVHFYGIGVGPIRHQHSLALVRDILMSANGNTFRDQLSVDRMRGLLPENRLTLAADPVLSLVPPVSRLEERWPPARQLRIGFNVRHISSIPETQTTDLGVRLAQALLEKFDVTLTFLPMNARDVSLGAQIRSRLPHQLADRFMLSPYNPRALQSHVDVYRTIDMAVTMRLHTAVLASIHHVPVVGLDCNPKIPGFLNEIGLGSFVVRVSDGLSSIEPQVDDVLSKTAALLHAWPELRAGVWERLRLCREREQLNITELRRSLVGSERAAAPPRQQSIELGRSSYAIPATHSRVTAHAARAEPRVSVVIPSFNRAPLVREAVGSMLNQTFGDFDVWVVDDGSTDDTREAVEAFGDRRVHYVYQDNAGVTRARNAAIRASRGEYVALLDSDDISLPDRLQQQVDLLDSYPNVDAVFSDLWKISEDGKRQRFSETLRRFTTLLPPLVDDTWYGIPARAMLHCLLVEWPLKPSALMLRRRCFDAVGVFDEKRKKAEREFLIHCALRDMSFGYIHRPLVSVRVWSGSIHLAQPLRGRDEWISVLRDLRNSPQLSSFETMLATRGIADEYWWLARHHRRHRSWLGAFKALTHALAAYGSLRIAGRPPQADAALSSELRATPCRLEQSGSR